MSHSDSLIRRLVSEIDEQDWEQVEIIGWLYQFYISARSTTKLSRRVVASEDIPCRYTALHAELIVKYLVHKTRSVDNGWQPTLSSALAATDGVLSIEPAVQTPAVQEQLKEITPTSLNPEELTLLDPACGSGHILVEARTTYSRRFTRSGVIVPRTSPPSSCKRTCSDWRLTTGQRNWRRSL